MCFMRAIRRHKLCHIRLCYHSYFWLSNNIITQKARALADSALELVYFHLNIDPNDFPGVVVKV